MTEGEDGADADYLRFIATDIASHPHDASRLMRIADALDTRTPTAAPSDEGWQPIETAPIDEVVLVSNSVHTPFCALKCPHTGDWFHTAAGIPAWSPEDAYQPPELGGYWRAEFNSPKLTHWMPLPEPPPAIEGEKK